MILKSIDIKGFRGLREFNHSFEKNKSLIIYGLNGTGKSSLFAALNFVITGKFPYISSVEVSSPQVYRHKALDDQTNAYVNLAFEHSNCTYTIKREIKPDGTVITTTSDPIALDICQDKLNQLCFLTRNDFVSMVDTVERDSWQRITPFLGFDEISKLREGLRYLNNNIKRFLGLTQLEQTVSTDNINFKEKQSQYKTCLDELSIDKISHEFIKRELEYISKITVDFKNYSEIPWIEIEQNIPGGERIKEISNELQKLSEVVTICQIPKLPSDRLKPTLEFLLQLYNQKNLGHDLLHFNFYTYANATILNYNSQPCPICGLKPQDWDVVRLRLTKKTFELKEIQNKYNDAKTCLTTYLSLIQATINKLDELQNPRSEQSDFNTNLKIFKDFINLGLKRLDSKPVCGLSNEEIEAFENSRKLVNDSFQNLKNVLKEIETKLKDEQAKLSDNPKLKRFFKIRELCSLYIDYYKAYIKLKGSQKHKEVTEDLVDKIQKIYKIVDLAEADLSADLLYGLENELKRIFCILTDQEQIVPSIKLITERGIRTAQIIINDFYGLGPVCARDYLSEANRNSIGLAIYFAGLLKRMPMLNTLFLDDITHSCDNNHRRGLASFIVNELSGAVQLIIMTHDKSWHDRIFNSMTDKRCKSLKVIDWSMDGITYQSEKWSSLLDKASQKIYSHDHTGGNALRQALEQFLSEICERLKVEFPYRETTAQITLNEKRERLEGAIKEVWRTGNGIIDPNKPEILLLINSQQIANLSSHYGSFDKWDYQDLLDALNDVNAVLNVFACKNLIGESTCGCLLTSLKKISGNVPTCPHCNKPFLL